MTRAALAYGAGITLIRLGLPAGPLLLTLLLSLPIAAWFRPRPGRSSGPRFPSRMGWGALPLSWLATSGMLVAGVLAGVASLAREATDCRIHLPSSAQVEVSGRFLGRPAPGRAIPFRVHEGLPGGCRGTVRAVWPRGEPPPPTGDYLNVRARWEGRGFPEPGRGEWAGRLRLLPQAGAPGMEGPDGPSPGSVRPPDGASGAFLGLRGRILDRMAALWGERAPMVEALVLARREHLDPELRDAFGRSGTAHLLAISGFHVGVVAGLLLALLRLAGAGPRHAVPGAALGAWGYVLAIGAPDAALRASVLLTLLAAARLRGRPPWSIGTLSSAFLGLLLVNPAALDSVGFQLSFAGTLGLVTLRRPLEVLLERGWRGLGLRPPGRRPGSGSGERWLRGSSEGLVAGVAATLPTLPLLAWHFDRISLVGIPATLMVAPVVSLAIPGIGAALGLSWLLPPLGTFIAGGVDLLLASTEWFVLQAAGWPGAGIWVSRPGLLALCGAGGMTWWLLRLRMAGRIRPALRLSLASTLGATALLLVPLLPGPRTLDLHLLDVGQGDALALRFPNGGWVVVDAGPRGPGWDAGARRVLPFLHRHGVQRLEALVLTHPHLDHIGGAPALLRGIEVRGVLDPSLPVASAAYLEVQEAAREREVWWWPARAGQTLRRGGVSLEVLHPDPDAAAPTDPNDLSVVLLVRYGAVRILLTGDAYAAVEADILPRLPHLTALKAGHHGSRTSTSPAILRATRPGWVLVPVGDGNRFGHPHPEVLLRLEEAGARVLRTDRDGTVRLRFRPDGSTAVRTGR